MLSGISSVTDGKTDAANNAFTGQGAQPTEQPQTVTASRAPAAEQEKYNAMANVIARHEQIVNRVRK